jgi:hypothetical protein
MPTGLPRVARLILPLMWTTGRTVLAALRQRRRTVSAVLLPAVLASLLSGSPCFAMAQGTPAAGEHTAAMHAMHGGHATAPRHAEPLTPDLPCPHCPGHTVAASADSAGAVAVEATTGEGATGVSHRDADALPLPPSWMPLADSPAPPLIRVLEPTPGVITPSVPLHIRHCVLLI